MKKKINYAYGPYDIIYLQENDCLCFQELISEAQYILSHLFVIIMKHR